MRNPLRPGPGESLDDLALALQELRAVAGHPSYAEIALRIGKQREARGIPREESRPGRTTVYDAFRTGRRRLDAELVVEIARSLGATEDDCVHWGAACRRALQGSKSVKALVKEPETDEVEELRSWPPPPRVLVAILLACILVNLGGRLFVHLLPSLSLHLDMIGTAFSAITLGPWWGALVGLVTNVAGAQISGWSSIPFAVVNVAGALLWGYGVRRFGLGRTIPRFFGLCIVVALVCSILAAPIIEVLDHMDQHPSHGQDAMRDALEDLGWAAVLATFAANLLSSLVDKMLAGFLSLTVVEALPREFRAGLQHMGPPRS